MNILNAIRNLAIVSCTIGLLFSCAPKKRMIDETESTAKSSLVEAYEENILSYDQVEMVSDVNYSGEGMSLDFSGVFRMKSNEKIWGSFKKFGFEVARVLITNDSIFVLNRFQSSYMVDDLSRLKSMSGVPLEFTDLEQILLGGSFWTDELVQVNDSTLTKIATVKNEVVEAKHIFGEEQLVRKSVIQSQSNGELTIEYGDYNSVDIASLAMIRDITAFRKNSVMKVRLKTTNFDLESVKSMPFEIPSNYTRQSF